MKIQLSISLLASDQPAALERCLDSLYPLLMQIPGELIIVHTGTDAGIRELASQYTDQVIPFVWCDDFSAARNIGLQAAKGEWFLFIDDDEWFEDTSEICSFFQSGEYQKYGMACYKKRDYFDWSGTNYSDFYAMRMMRLFPGVHFQNPIHEEPAPLLGPCKYFNTYVHHYGYVRTSGRSKVSRNLDLLNKYVSIRPLYVKNYIQLVSEYGSEEDWEKAEDCCRKGLGLYKSRKVPPDSGMNWLQSELIEILYIRNKHSEAEKEALLILNHASACELVTADIYAILTLSCSKCRNPEKTLQYGLEFEKALQYLEKHPWLWTRQNYGSLSEEKIKNPKRLCQLRVAGLEAALDRDEQKHAAFFFSHLPWEHNALMEQFYSGLDRLDRCFHEQFTALLTRYPSGSSFYQIFQKATHMKENTEERQRLFIKCMTDSDSYYLRKHIVREFLSSGMGLGDIVCRLDLETWRRYLDEIVKTLSNSEAQNAWTAESTLKEEYLSYKLILKKELLARALTQEYYTGEKFIEALSEYAASLLLFYKTQYREELFQEENFNLLPQDCRFALLVSEAVQKLEEKAYAQAARILCSALRLDTEMTGVLNEFSRLITEKMKKPVQDAGGEFLVLAEQMKSALGTMLQNRQYEEALSVITQLSPLLPGDLELLRIRQKLLRESVLTLQKAT